MKRITRGGIQDILLIQEAMQEAKISEIASEIAAAGNKKFVMIAGPSSSGKTTFSHRLSIQLAAHGMKPHPIAVDNYFIDRHLTPVDEFGERILSVWKRLMWSSLIKICLSFWKEKG